MLASLAVAVLALILALVAPAIGGKSGPSTKKLAKQLQALQAQVSALQLQQGPPGPQGPQGATGPRGPRGPGAVKVDFDKAQAIGMAPSTIAVVHELTIKASCLDDFVSSETLLDLIFSSSVAATVNGLVSRDSNVEGATVTNLGLQLNSGQDTHIDKPTTPGGFDRHELNLVYWNAVRTMAIHLHAVANHGTGRCQVQGTIVPVG